MMKISTKGRYATRIMVNIALDESGIAQKQKIARDEGISADYVEQILIKLKAADLVRSHRGKNGGFSLTRKPESITVADVLEAAEGPLNLVDCLDERCERTSVCVTRPLWKKANDALGKVFSGTTVKDLADYAREIREKKSLSFAI
jgi:Rrf2 family protein